MNVPQLSPEHEGDRRAWETASSRWLDRVYPAIAEAARRVAHAARAVVELTVHMAHMRQMLAARSVRATVELHWHPADNFIRIATDSLTVGCQIGRRWAGLIAAMDPAHDIAVLLHSRCGRALVLPVPRCSRRHTAGRLIAA